MSRNHLNDLDKKIIHLSDLKEHRPWQSQQVVLVGGCFDILHYGHLQFLIAASQTADRLVVALESDEFIKQRKKRQPVHSQVERAGLLASLVMVDYVLILPYLSDYADYSGLVKIVQPKIIAVTAEDRHLEFKRQHAAEIGAELKVVTPLLPNFSSSKIIEYETIPRD